MERNDPGNISFTFDALPTPAMRPGSSWLSYWILGVLCCEGLGQFLWVDGPPAFIPSFIAGVPRALALSTDKAVSPANLYGATKLCAERLFIQANVYAAANATRLSCVRYGNVVGSRGSVIPLFLDQASSGELTVTDERMTRFWITLDQAVQFVADCIARMEGGELFIPKIPSMRVLDLAEAVAPGLPIRYTGIRPGEKLHESLITPEEARHTLDAGWCYVVEPEHPFWGGRGVADATPVSEDFVYTSDRNAEWLDVDALRSLLSPAQRTAEPAAIEVG